VVRLVTMQVNAGKNPGQTKIIITKIKINKGGITKCLSNESKKPKKDWHQKYFFNDYNNTYNIESSSASRSILLLKNLNYFKNKIKNSNKLKIKENKEITSWTLDSGTTYHMTGMKENLSEFKKCTKRIFFANGRYILSEGIGTFSEYINNYKIILKNVLYVPSFKKNLISVDALSDQHYKSTIIILHQYIVVKIKNYVQQNQQIQKHISFGFLNQN